MLWPSMVLLGFVQTTFVYKSNSGPASPSRRSLVTVQVACPAERNPNSVITSTDAFLSPSRTEIHFSGVYQAVENSRMAHQARNGVVLEAIDEPKGINRILCATKPKNVGMKASATGGGH